MNSRLTMGLIFGIVMAGGAVGLFLLLYGVIFAGMPDGTRLLLSLFVPPLVISVIMGGVYIAKQGRQL